LSGGDPTGVGKGAYHGRVVVAGGTAILNGVLLASAVVPVLVVIVLAWLFLRAGRRHDERERAAGRRPLG